ncbi:hypothetical protein [Marinobacter sp. SS8-8]|uniref:hypothetical protein n=1 Tax=Marinobacter sp. SS8-8 TaxID=3050452 RepID=UPI0026DF9E8B|nr:hypothetical protein [Marinobacter sp. SS8-8]
MSGHKKTLGSGQLAKGSLIKACTTNNSTASDALLEAKRRFKALGGLYSQCTRALMVRADTAEAANAVVKFVEEYDRAAKALHDGRARAALRHMQRAVKRAAHLRDQQDRIQILQGVKDAH